MSEPTITCPNCHTDIKLTESLAGPLLEQTRHEFRAQLAVKDQAIAESKEQLATEREALERERQGLDGIIAERLEAER